MMDIPAASPSDFVVINLPAGDADWAGILAQFCLHLIGREGKPFANWAIERLLRATRNTHGVVALADGRLLGMVLYEMADQSIELSLPWVTDDNPTVEYELVQAALRMAREQYPDARYIRAERQLLPDEQSIHGLEQAGFACHWRHRMLLDLPGWHREGKLPSDYYITRWHTKYLDAAAEVVYRANLGALDALLYAPFFGESPAQCRRGLLAILAGRYGPIHPRATLCAFTGEHFAGLNLVMGDTPEQASIVEISVDPAHQGKGLGRALVVHSLRILADEHVERVDLAVTAENTRALHLYESLGFQRISTFPVCVWSQVTT